MLPSTLPLKKEALPVLPEVLPVLLRGLPTAITYNVLPATLHP